MVQCLYPNKIILLGFMRKNLVKKVMLMAAFTMLIKKYFMISMSKHFLLKKKF